MRIGEQHAARCEPVQVWSQRLGMAVHTADPVIQIIDGNEQDIGLVSGLSRSRKR